MMRKWYLALLVLLQACAMQPDGLETVATLDVQRYQGNWYEIARLDHSFERGLEQVSASYTLREDGGIDVVNKGYHTGKKVWKEAHGRAYFREDSPNGKLKVSFFWPFYGAYNIVWLDEQYRYVLVIGPSVDYAWIMAREPQMPDNLYQDLQEKAETLGVPGSGWIRVRHSPVPAGLITGP